MVNQGNELIVESRCRRLVNLFIVRLRGDFYHPGVRRGEYAIVVCVDRL